MDLYRLRAHHDHEGLAGLIDAPEGAPASAPFGALLEGNLLAPDPPAIPTGLPAPRLLAWSGSLAEGSMFDRDAPTWMPAGLGAFRDMCDAVRPSLEASGTRLLFRPHARHVLCDPRRARTLAEEWRETGAPFALALDGAAMLESTMLDTAEDHFERALEMLAPFAECVILANAAPDPMAQSADEENPAPLLPSPLHRGVVDPGLIVAAWRRHTPSATPVVLLDEDLAAQQRLLSQIP